MSRGWTRAIGVSVVMVVALSVPGRCGIAHAWGDDRHIALGDSGLHVAQIQQILASAGYTVAVDGLYGPQTERAVRHWQRANRLAVDGIAGSQTLRSLISWGEDRVAARIATRERSRLPRGSLAPEAIIRSIWPPDLADRAVAIAYRESRFVPSARNSCCYGLFQINWEAHRGWLASIGITAPAQLLDPTTNATAALALFRLDGWTPWATGGQ